MLEFPGIKVGLHAPVKPLGAEAVAQVIEGGGGFFVDHGAVVDGAEVVGVALHRLVNGHPGAQEIGEYIPALVGFPDQVEALHERRGAFFKPGQPELIAVFLDEVPGLVEGVDALVHPRVGAFVAAEDAVKPVVPHLVDDHSLQPQGAPAVANDGDVGVFHAAARTDGAVHRGHVVVRVLPVPFGVVVGGVLDVGQRRAPQVSGCRGKHGPRSHGSP